MKGSLTRQLDLNLLELFDTIYRTRNLTEAGQRQGLNEGCNPAAVFGDQGSEVIHQGFVDRKKMNPMRPPIEPAAPVPE